MIMVEYIDDNRNHGGLYINLEEKVFSILTPNHRQTFFSISVACDHLAYYGFKTKDIYYDYQF